MTAGSDGTIWYCKFFYTRRSIHHWRNGSASCLWNLLLRNDYILKIHGGWEFESPMMESLFFF